MRARAREIQTLAAAHLHQVRVTNSPCVHQSVVWNTAELVWFMCDEVWSLLFIICFIGTFIACYIIPRACVVNVYGVTHAQCLFHNNEHNLMKSFLKPNVSVYSRTVPVLLCVESIRNARARVWWAVKLTWVTHLGGLITFHTCTRTCMALLCPRALYEWNACIFSCVVMLWSLSLCVWSLFMCSYVKHELSEIVR